MEISFEVESILLFDINDEDGFVNMNFNMEILIGSVLISVFVEMNCLCMGWKKFEDGIFVFFLENIL